MDAQIEIPSGVVNTSEKTTPTSEERTFAALAHGSIILFGLGILAALVIWALRKDKSPYVRFQALQSIAFSLVVAIYSFVTGMLVFVLIIGEMAVFLLKISSLETSVVSLPYFLLTMMIPLFSWAIILPLSLSPFLVRLYAAIRTFMGADFRYPWLGKQLEIFDS